MTDTAQPPAGGPESLATTLADPSWDQSVESGLMRLWSRQPQWPLLLLTLGALLLGGLATVVFRGNGAVAMVWSVNAWGVVWLLASPRRWWPAVLLGLMGAVWSANWLAGDAAGHALLFVPANALETLIGAALLLRWGGHRQVWAGAGRCAQALLLGGWVPSLLGACVGALTMWVRYGDQLDSLLRFWLLWLEGSVLGAMGMLPLGLAVLACGRRSLRRWLMHPEWLLWALVTTLVSVLAMVYLPYPFVYLGLPLAAAALRLGFVPLAFLVWWQAQVLGVVLASDLFVLSPLASQWQQVLTYLPAVAALLLPLLLAAATEQVRLKTEVQARSEQRYRALYERTPAMMYSVSPDGRLLSVSRLWLERMGYHADEVIGRHSTDFLDLASRRRAWAHWLPEFLQSGQCRDIEFRMLTKSGQPVDVLLSATSERDEDGRITRVLAVLEDVTRKRLAEELAAEHVRSRVTLESIADGVIRTDAHGCIEYLNPVAADMTGWPQAQAIGRSYGEVVCRYGLSSTLQGDLPLVDPLPVVLAEGSHALAPRQLMLRRRDGRELPVQESVAPMRDEAGLLIGAVAVLQDVSAAHQMAVELAHRAHHDALTGLPNRVLFMDRLQQRLQLAQRTGSLVAVMYLDLDHFKLINDQYGHEAGDALLREVAQRLVAGLRASDTACRQGGDEFVVLLPTLDKPEDAGEVAAHLLSKVAQPFQLGTDVVSVSFSIGIALFPLDAQDDVTLLRHADAAMYRAKHGGRKRWVYHAG